MSDLLLLRDVREEKRERVDERSESGEDIGIYVLKEGEGKIIFCAISNLKIVATFTP